LDIKPYRIKYGKKSFRRRRNSNSSFRFWWFPASGVTEEWTGAGAAVTKTITVS
jgi:hypothetical protein